MLIAQISDTHIAGANRKAYGIVPTSENLVHCVEHINQLSPRPDIVLVTGDITYTGHLDEAQYAVTLLNRLHAPYYIVPGNHDDRSTLWSAFDRKSCPGQNKDCINYVVEGFDIRLIGMDSTIAGSGGGELCNAQISWLKEQLAMEADKPTIIFMHHPPAKFGVLETDKDGFIGADTLGDTIAQHGNIKAILSGHIHLSAHLAWCGTVISTAPSMGLQLALDLTLTRHSEFIQEAPSYQLHYFNPEKNLVSHLITVKEIDGPYRFKEYPENNC